MAELVYDLSGQREQWIREGFGGLWQKILRVVSDDEI